MIGLPELSEPLLAPQAKRHPNVLKRCFTERGFDYTPCVIQEGRGSDTKAGCAYIIRITELQNHTISTIYDCRA